MKRVMKTFLTDFLWQKGLHNQPKKAKRLYGKSSEFFTYYLKKHHPFNMGDAPYMLSLFAVASSYND